MPLPNEPSLLDQVLLALLMDKAIAKSDAAGQTFDQSAYDSLLNRARTLRMLAADLAQESDPAVVRAAAAETKKAAQAEAARVRAFEARVTHQAAVDKQTGHLNALKAELAEREAELARLEKSDAPLAARALVEGAVELYTGRVEAAQKALDQLLKRGAPR